jgi:hypothetical protein
LKIEKLLEKQFSDIIKNENDIQNDIARIISKVKASYTDKFLLSEIEGAAIIRQAWLEKKMFFEKKLPAISDPDQQFSIYTQIKEINEKISFYNNQISNSLIQISN